MQLNWISSIPCVVTWHLLLQCTYITHHPLLTGTYNSVQTGSPAYGRAEHVLSWTGAETTMRPRVASLTCSRMKSGQWPSTAHRIKTSTQRGKTQQLPRSFVHKCTTIYIVSHSACLVKKMFLIVQDKDKMCVEGGGVIHALVYTVRWTFKFYYTKWIKSGKVRY